MNVGELVAYTMPEKDRTSLVDNTETAASQQTPTTASARRRRRVPVRQVQGRRGDQGRIRPILGNDGEWSEAPRVGSTVPIQRRELRRTGTAAQRREPTLQLTGDQIVEAQAESRLHVVHRLLETRVHRGIRILR